MRKYQGFTLMEIVVVTIIVGVLAMIAVPNYTGFMDRARAQDGIQNLLAIYAGQLNYAIKNDNQFCTAPVSDPNTLCGTTANINLGLGLSIITNGITYECHDPAGATARAFFQCTAQRDGDGDGTGNEVGDGTALTITIDNASGIVLTGNGNRNPSCNPANLC